MTALLVETKDRVRFITLNRPDRHNAFDDSLIAELTTEFDRAGADPALRAVVLDASGKSFSAGADLEWMRRMAGYGPERNLADARALARLMAVIDALPKPVIGVVQGAAYGGGVGLVACCDLVVAAESARFCLSEVKLGLIPAVISPYVARAIGARASRRYFITAEVFSAATALALGLVGEVAPADQLETIRDGWLAAIKANGPAAIAAAKQLVAHVGEAVLDDDLRDWTARRIADIRASEEGREGLQAFLDKRQPDWVKV